MTTRATAVRIVEYFRDARIQVEMQNDGYPDYKTRNADVIALNRMLAERIDLSVFDLHAEVIASILTDQPQPEASP